MLPDSDKLTIARKVGMLVAVPLLLETFILVILGFLLFEEQQQVQREATTERIIDACDAVSHLATYAISQLAMYTFTHSDHYLQLYRQTKSTHEQQYAILEQYCQSNPVLREKAKLLKRNSDQIYYLFEDAHAKVMEQEGSFGRSHHTFKSMPEFRTDRRLLPLALQGKIKEADDFRLLVEKEGQPKISSSTWKLLIKILLAVGVIANVLLSLALARLISTRINSRLHRLVDNSIKLASGEALGSRMKGADEIAKVDEMFHLMAQRIEIANKKEKGIVDNAVDVIGSLDKKGRFTAVNPACVKVLAYQPSDLLGRHLSDIVVDEDKQNLGTALQRISVSAPQATIEPQSSLESGVKCNDGRIAQILWSILWSQPQQAYFFIAHDITERKLDEETLKESESRVRLILESMPVGLLITDEQNIIEVANMRSAQMFGYANADMLSRPLQFLFAPGLRDGALASNTTINEVTQSKSKELEACNSTGERFQVELSLTDFYLRGERKILAVVADITERKEIELLKKQFVAMVSRDLRAPLVNIQQAFALLLSGDFGDLNERSQSLISRSSRETERLIELINTLLDMDKLETGQIDTQRELVDVISIVSAAVSSVGYLAEKNGIQIHTQHDSSKVLADGPKLIQVLVNLLANAIKFSPKGSPILISAKQEAAAIKFSVIDQGRGIPEAHAATIFERFKQVETSDQTIKGGSGLGLSICKAIVEAHGGNIGLESRPGRGSTFWLTIPNQATRS